VSILGSVRGPCYESAISFGTMVRLTGEALCFIAAVVGARSKRPLKTGDSMPGAAGRVRQAWAGALAVSHAFLEEGRLALGEVRGSGQRAGAAGVSCASFSHQSLDGKTIKARAEASQATAPGGRGGVIGGKGLVAVDNRTGLAFAMEANPDGDSSETQFGAWFARAHQAPSARAAAVCRRPWGLATSCKPNSSTADGDHFIGALNSCCIFTPDPDRRPRLAKTKTADAD